MPAISIVIPTLNEAEELPEPLRRAKALDGLHEIIVVDAGSTDATQDIAREHNCKILQCEPSRGRQLRLGAEKGTGEVVLLLHADTWLPENAASAIAETLAKPRVIAGAFYKRFRDRGAFGGFMAVFRRFPRLDSQSSEGQSSEVQSPRGCRFAASWPPLTPPTSPTSRGPTRAPPCGSGAAWRAR